jgi:hypothetical protein
MTSTMMAGRITRIPVPQTKSPEATVLADAHKLIGIALDGAKQVLSMGVAGSETETLCTLLTAATTALDVATAPVKRLRLAGETLYSIRCAIDSALGETAKVDSCRECDGGVMVAYTDDETICDQCGATRRKQVSR